MPGGGGNVQNAWQICRSAKTMRIARKGANVGPKIAEPINESPMRSMKRELMMSAVLAARGFATK
jgi:hypothetical protein